ncbi:MAG: serpin family protein [Fimbriimonadales bacterium]|nr:serpin family protein [Fimbriimonadales bacterium]
MRTTTLLCVLAALMLTGCGVNTPDETPRRASEPVQVQPETRKANLTFAFKLLQQLDDSDQNLCFSPLSLTIALATALNGAAGDTYDAIAQTLGYSQVNLDAFNKQMSELTRLLQPSDAVSIHNANGLWLADDFEAKPEYLKTMQDHYDARIDTLDFEKPAEAADVINRWTSEQTQGLISQLFTPNDFALAPPVAMVMVNALYFEGKWQHRFPKAATRDAPFRLQGGTEKRVPMMRLKEQLPYYKGEGFQAVALPYGMDEYRFYLFLPDEGRTVAQLREQFTPQNWSKWMQGFQLARGTVQMPRFKIESVYDLNKALTALGMGIAFDSNRADFSRLAKGQIWLHLVRQKATVEADEEGTKAAAATGMVYTMGYEPKEFQIIADRPFMFAIVHHPTNTILFLGIVREP